MKTRFVFLSIALFLTGCGRPSGNEGFKDPLIRQQLTTMLSNLPSYPSKAVFGAERELSALCDVNHSKMSSKQSEILFAALDNLRQVSPNVERFLEGGEGKGPTGRWQDENRRGFDKNYVPPTYQEHQKKYDEAKRLITEAAGTF